MTEKSSTLNRKQLTMLAWMSMLVMSRFPDIIAFEFFGGVPYWFNHARWGFMFAFITFSLIARLGKGFIAYSLVLIVYREVSRFFELEDFAVPAVQNWFGNNQLIQRFQPGQFLYFVVALMVFFVLLLFGYGFKKGFLQPGKLKAKVEPIKWLGFLKPKSWVSFGGQLSLYLALGTAVILWLTSNAQLSQLNVVLSILPTVLLVSAMNAFSEEVVYRNGIVAPLENDLGGKQVAYLSAAYFGLAHYWGVPSGVPGVLLSGFLGWLLAKAMVETRGMFWSWWIHFLQDVVIFSFLAIYAVSLGG